MSCNTLVIYSEMAVWQLEVRPNKLFSFTHQESYLPAGFSETSLQDQTCQAFD